MIFLSLRVTAAAEGGLKGPARPRRSLRGLGGVSHQQASAGIYRRIACRYLLPLCFHASNIKRFVYLESVAVCFNDPLPTQFSDFRRQTTALYFQIICQLLAIIWYFKFQTAKLFSLKHQIRHQLFTCRALGCDLDFLVKHQILCRNNLKKIVNHLLMELTSITA